MSEKQLKIIVRDLLAEQLSPFKKIVQEDVAEIKKSTQYMSDCFDEQKKRVDEFLKEIKRLREENKLLKDRVQDLEDKINISEQKGKEKNLVLVGIPKQTEEQPKKIIKKIFATLKPEINENDIEETYRITKHEKAPILVKFKNYETKLKIVQKVKEMKGLKVQECGLTGENKNIFFNDDLTKQNQQLFKKAREYKVNKGLKAAYVFNGRIYIRENEQDPPIRIRSEADLV